MFGIGIDLTFNGRKDYTSPFGGILSIAVYILLFFWFGV